MSSVNKVILIGRVGRDPEIRQMKNSKSVVNLSLATTSKRKDANGETIEDTQWHRLTAYDKLAEIIGQYVHKGSLLYVEGTLKYGKYTDKDGVEKNITDIVIGQMQMLGGKSESHDDRRNNENEQQRQQSFDDDEIPF